MVLLVQSSVVYLRSVSQIFSKYQVLKKIEQGIKLSLYIDAWTSPKHSEIHDLQLGHLDILLQTSAICSVTTAQLGKALVSIPVAEPIIVARCERVRLAI